MSSRDDILKRESPWGSNPGGGGDGNGSGQRRPPPNIDDIIRKAQGSIGRIFPGGKGSSKPIYFGILILLVLWALSGLYRVLPDEQGVVLRFGKFIKTTQPGLNYHIPFPVERVLTPKVTKVNCTSIYYSVSENVLGLCEIDCECDGPRKCVKGKCNGENST